MKKTLLLVVAAVMSCVYAMGQWNSNPAVNLLAWPDANFYSTDMQICPDGSVWLAVNQPRNGHVSVALQLIDSAGYNRFEEPIVVSDYPSRTWVSAGEFLFVDRDGNAIVAVYDWRQGEEYLEGYTVYKVSPEGEFLWGEDGITLEGENVYDLVAGMSMCQISDGSYVLAWMRNQPDNSGHFSIELQRISAEGEMLWDPEEVRMYNKTTPYMYPYVVDGGNAQVILLYAKGSTQELYARKLDFDGTPAWSEDTRVYNGGWGSIPMWTLLDVHPSGDGGLILSWNDDRYYEEIEHPYMAYVKNNGELGFAIDNGQLLGLTDWRALQVKCLYDKASDSFYAIWNEASSGQSWNRVVAQRISKEGDLLWGDTGLELKPMEQTYYGYLSLQSAINDEVAFFYMRNYAGTFGDVEAFVTTVNVNDTTARRESEFTKGDRVSEKGGLQTTPMIDGKYWVAKWTDGGSYEDEEMVDKLLMQRINYDFTLGMPEGAAVEAVRNENNTFVALATLVEGEAMFATDMAVATQATLAIYDINGALVATPFDGVLAAGRQYIEWAANVPAGIYVATLTTAHGVETVKLLVK